MGVLDLATTKNKKQKKTSETIFEGLVSASVLQIMCQNTGTKFEKLGRASLNYRFMYPSVGPACIDHSSREGGGGGGCWGFVVFYPRGLIFDVTLGSRITPIQAHDSQKIWPFWKRRSDNKRPTGGFLDSSLNKRHRPTVPP